jgi:competence protein ComGC
MKPRFSNKPTNAFTLIELLVVIAVLFILLALVDFGPPPSAKKKAQRIACVNNLKQIGSAFQLWENDHSDKFPMSVSVTNGGAMELANSRNVAAIIAVMSNELTTPKLLICYADTNHIAATNFATGFSAANLSYFIGVDAEKVKPQMFLSGDDNFAIGDVPVKSGLLELSTNTPIAWSAGRHISPNSHFWTEVRYKYGGNIGLADGSVQQLSTDGLQQALQQTGIATNRLAIP